MPAVVARTDGAGWRVEGSWPDVAVANRPARGRRPARVDAKVACHERVIQASNGNSTGSRKQAAQQHLLDPTPRGGTTLDGSGRQRKPAPRPGRVRSPT
jgi:hypothetical protein